MAGNRESCIGANVLLKLLLYRNKSIDITYMCFLMLVLNKSILCKKKEIKIKINYNIISLT